MELFGIQWTQADLASLLDQLRQYALPRLVPTAVLLLLAAVLHKAGGWILRKLVERFAVPTETRLDNIIFRHALRALLISIWFWVTWRIALLWDLEGLSRIVVGLWIVALFIPLSGFVAELLLFVERRVDRKTTIPLSHTALPLVNKIIQGTVLAIGILVALDSMGVSIGPLLAGAGVAGLAVSLAAQDTLSNLIAGILLIMDRPFQVGDRIELWTSPQETGSWGDVIEIGLRATKIRNPDNLVVIIPNNEIMRRDIVNYTASGGHIRLRIPYGIAYDAEVKKAKKLILEAASDVEGVKPEPAPIVIVRSFSESSVDLQLRIWIDDGRSRRAIADEITERVKEAFDREGIEIPYPKRDVYLKSLPPVELVREPGRKDSEA